MSRPWELTVIEGDAKVTHNGLVFVQGKEKKLGFTYNKHALIEEIRKLEKKNQHVCNGYLNEFKRYRVYYLTNGLITRRSIYLVEKEK